MIQIPTIFIQAIVFASLISVLSVGWTLTHLTAKIPNFAHGGYAAVGVYVTYTFAKTFELNPYYAIPLAFLLGGAIGFILYVVVVNVLKKMGGGTVVLTIATIAIGIFLTALMNIYATWIRLVTGKYAFQFMVKESDFMLFGYKGILYVSFALCLTVAVLLHIFLTRTKMGVAMRATAEDPALASVIGINTDQIQQISWFMTGGLAAVAGSMFPFWFLSSPAIGTKLLSTCMAGSLLGGIESAYGAIIGGFIAGFSQVVLTSWLIGLLGTWVGQYRSMVPMVMLVLVLLLEPRGFVGLVERLRATTIGRQIESRLKR